MRLSKGEDRTILHLPLELLLLYRKNKTSQKWCLFGTLT